MSEAEQHEPFQKRLRTNGRFGTAPDFATNAAIHSLSERSGHSASYGPRFMSTRPSLADVGRTLAPITLASAIGIKPCLAAPYASHAGITPESQIGSTPRIVFA